MIYIIFSITTLLNTCPTTHPAHDWICKNFKCSPWSVLFMKTENHNEKIHREYFLIGENRSTITTQFLRQLATN